MENILCLERKKINRKVESRKHKYSIKNKWEGKNSRKEVGKGKGGQGKLKKKQQQRKEKVSKREEKSVNERRGM